MSNKRVITLFAVLGAVTIAATGSWIAGSSIQSPAEMAARTAPPTASPILVPVEQRVLSSDVVTRGTARFGLPQSIAIVPSSLKSEAGVITSLPLRNVQIQAGDVLLTASGRPVFVLQGKVPAFQDLVPGSAGDNVRQLESALKRLGFDPGSMDGIYDEQTSAAVAKWYTSAGWEPFGPTRAQLANIRALEKELVVATNNKLATAAAAAAAPLALESVRANVNHANRIAAAEVVAKTASRDKVMADRNATSEQRANANAALEAAQAAARATELRGQVAVQAAVNAQIVAERDAKLAEDTAARIADDLEDARRNTGIQVPVDEIVFIPSLPVRVEQINVVVGDPARGPVLTVTNNQLAIDSSLPLEEGPLVKPGMAVAIDEPSLRIKAKGVVERVADTPGTFGVDGYHIYFEVRVTETPTALDGFSLRLTIPIESTGGVVTAVPISALHLAADGTSRVQVNKNGSLEYVVVEPGLASKGYVEVKPVSGSLDPGELVVVGYERENSDLSDSSPNE